MPLAIARATDDGLVPQRPGDRRWPQPAPPDRYLREHGRVMVVVLAAAGLAVLAQFSVWIPAAGGLVQDFPQAAGSVAAAGSLFGLAYAAGALVVGPLADRYGRRRVLLAGLLGLVGATLATAASPTWPLYLGTRMAQGLIAAAIPVAANSWVATALPPRQRLVVAAVLVAAWQGSTQAGQAYGQLLAPLGWRTVQASLAAAYFLTALGAWAHMADVRVAARATSTVAGLLRRAAALARRPPVVACWLLAGLLQGSVLAMYVGLERHAADPRLLLWARLAGLAGVVITPLLVVADPARPRRLIMTGVGLAAGGLLAQAVLLEPEMVVAGCVLVGFGVTFSLPPLIVVLTRLAAGVEASAVAAYGACLAAGASLGVQLPGWLPPWLGYPVLAAAVAAALAAGALALWASDAA